MIGSGSFEISGTVVVGCELVIATDGLRYDRFDVRFIVFVSVCKKKKKRMSNMRARFWFCYTIFVFFFSFTDLAKIGDEFMNYESELTFFGPNGTVYKLHNSVQISSKSHDKRP